MIGTIANGYGANTWKMMGIKQLHQNQNPTNQHMGHRSRGHHHAAKLNIQNQDMQKTRE